jgi:acylphosphatase
MNELTARRCFVSGRVQGVFFRATTATRARELGLDGYAINLPDGRVEVLAVGEAQAVDTLAQWLWQGSAMSEVSAVECQSVDELDEKYRRGRFITG